MRTAEKRDADATTGLERANDTHDRRIRKNT
jgi:hypothetical protein